jgi:outer membrane protein OmpA-like peptidoglycan-associated protein
VSARASRPAPASVFATVFGTVLGAALLSGGCIGQKLLGEVEGTQIDLQRAIRDGSKAINCAPKETAIAEANIKFAQDALARGEYFRGKEHADVAAFNTDRARKLTDPERCRDAPRGSIGDKDGDGYDDEADQCPDKPEDIDNFADEDGCPDADNDKDKLCDPWVQEKNLGSTYAAECKSKDECPDKPEDYDGDRDEDGCPDLKAEFDGCSVKIAEKVFFKFNKWDIDPRSFELLDDVATVMNQVPEELHFRVEGHTDSKGKDKYNKDLSQKRANAVTDYLVGKGVKRDRVAPVGFGEEKPIDSNKTNDGRARNRRVEFNVSNADCKRNP